MNWALDTLRGDLQEHDHLSSYTLVADGSSTYLAESGQAVDLVRRKANVVIHEMVDVLQPFYRDGRHIPPLLRPRAHVTVNPAVRGGVPVIEGTRVPCDEVAALLRDGIPPERISEYYPSVTPSAALDAADFADYVNSYDPPRNHVRLLLDENVSRPLHQAINTFVLGHEVVHLLDLGRWSGTRDENLYPRAVAEGFHVILTNDARQMRRPREVEAIAASGLAEPCPHRSRTHPETSQASGLSRVTPGP